MGHDESADEPRRDAPRSRPGIFLIAAFVSESDLAGFGEILPEKMGRARLQRFAILHHRFDGIGRDRPGETLCGGLLPADDGHRQIVVAKIAIYIRASAAVFFFGLFGWSHGQYGLLATGIRSVRKNIRVRISHRTTFAHWLMSNGRSRYDSIHLENECADDHFRSGADDERFFQLARGHEFAVGAFFEPMMRHDGAFFGKSLDVLRFFFQKAQRDEEREIGVLMARGLEIPSRTGWIFSQMP